MSTIAHSKRPPRISSDTLCSLNNIETLDLKNFAFTLRTQIDNRAQEDTRLFWKNTPTILQPRKLCLLSCTNGKLRLNPCAFWAERTRMATIVESRALYSAFVDQLIKEEAPVVIDGNSSSNSSKPIIARTLNTPDTQYASNEVFDISDISSETDNDTITLAAM